MDLRLDRKIQFNDKTEYEGLYKWCLNEVGESATSNRDLIPWAWSFYFTASSLSVTREISIENNYGDDEQKRKETADVTTITGFLYSGGCWDGENLERDSNFSMFGTNRVIKKFDLRITQTTNDEDEHCWLWGCPSYEFELDFRSDITDDDVIVNVSLNAKRFNELARLIEAKQVDIATVRLSQVAGFYSDWSPSISTSQVKVLTSEHVIDGLEGKDIVPLTIGSVGKFGITLHSINNLKAKLNTKAIEFYRQFEEVADEQETESSLLDSIGFKQQAIDDNPSREKQLAFYAKLVKSLKIPLWLIFIVLLLMLGK
jgi:hypothetical protein